MLRLHEREPLTNCEDNVRSELIAERLGRSFREVPGCSLAVVSAEEWLRLPVEPRFRFGYLPPIDITDSGESWLVSVSPALIATVTEGLDDDLLDVYLTGVEALVLAHLMLEGESPAETMKRVEDQIYEQAPEALTLMLSVEAEAIDRGVVPQLP